MLPGVDIWHGLNANSGAVVAVAAVGSLAVTLLLLLEARTTRNLGRQAAVAGRLKLHPPASTLLELDVRPSPNLGSGTIHGFR